MTTGAPPEGPAPGGAGVGGRRPLPLWAGLLVPKGFLALLEDHRMWADRESIPVPFELGPLTFGLAPHGWGKYRDRLDRESGRIGFTKSTRLPAIRVQPRSEFLQAHGPAGTVAVNFGSLLRPVVENLGLSVALVLDLFCDLENLELCAGGPTGFSCRYMPPTTYEAGLICTGFAFGSRRRRPHQCADLRQDGRDGSQGHRLVGGGLGRASPRRRTGAALSSSRSDGRPSANSSSVGPDDVLAAVPSLWRYCSTEWLTLRRPTSDSIALAGLSTSGGGPRASGLARARRHRTQVHPWPQESAIVPPPHACPRGLPRELRRVVEDDVHRRHPRRPRCPLARRRGRAADPLRPTGPEAPSRSGLRDVRRR